MTLTPATPAYRIDGAPADARAFYALACDPACSVVVEACAGAGKTWMLVSRIVRALLEGAEPRQILAITFTKKAAGEMRERLSQWLAEFAHASQAQRLEALTQRGLAADRALELAPRLALLHEQLLAGGRAVEIRTFHGWFAQLLRAAPLSMLHEMGLAPRVQLLEDPEELATDLFRRFHAVVREDAGLREDFVTLVARRGRSRVRDWLSAAWRRRVEVEAADAAGTLADSVEPASAVWPAYAAFAEPLQRLQSPPVRELLLGVARELGRQSGANPRKAGEALERALAIDDLPGAFSAAVEALFADKGKKPRALSSPGFQQAIALLEDLRLAHEQQEAHEEHRRMVRLSRVLLAEYARLKRQRGLADMADLERCALHLLGDGAVAGWVQQRLDQRIRQVLIDEFQDTSPLQWQALHGWLSAYAGAGGGASGQRPPSVFIVGDPKQSIYRFRGAEPRVFVAAREFVAQALDGAVLECDHTRRNAPEVLGVVNEVFEAACAAGEYPGFRPHTTGAPAGAPGVSLLPRIERPPREAAALAQGWRDSLTVPRREPEEGLRQQEARQVALAVQSLLGEGLAPDDIFLLARKRAPLHEAAAALQALGIPHVAPEENLMMASPEVRDLVAVMDALASPSHDLSLAHALRSPVFGASDAELLWLSARAAGARWWPALLSCAQVPAHEVPAHLRRAATLLRGWSEALHRLPPHDLLDRLVDEAEVLPRMLAAAPPARRAAARQAVQSLLSLALQLDGARYASLYGFVRALKRRALKMPLGVQPGAVQLLTVHGAKGLEAKAVILMDADASASRDESNALLVDWPVEEAAPRRCAFVASESRCPAELQPLLEREREARAREELNGLYVAATRARDRLLLSSVEPHGKGTEGSWWSRIAPLAPAWQASASHGQVPPLPESVAWRPLPQWRRAPPDEPSTVPERSEEARLGEALHRVLEWAAEAPSQPLGPLAAAAAEAFGLEEGGAARVLQLARAVLSSEQARPFFDRDRLAWSGNEVSFAEEGGVVRLDRLVAIEQGGRRTWWVLDYKLQPAPQTVPAYLEQLARYRALVQRLQPGDAVRAAFVTSTGEVIEPAP